MTKNHDQNLAEEILGAPGGNDVVVEQVPDEYISKALEKLEEDLDHDQIEKEIATEVTVDPSGFLTGISKAVSDSQNILSRVVAAQSLIIRKLWHDQQAMNKSLNEKLDVLARAPVSAPRGKRATNGQAPPAPQTVQALQKSFVQEEGNKLPSLPPGGAPRANGHPESSADMDKRQTLRGAQTLLNKAMSEDNAAAVDALAPIVGNLEANIPIRQDQFNYVYANCYGPNAQVAVQ